MRLVYANITISKVTYIESIHRTLVDKILSHQGINMGLILGHTYPPSTPADRPLQIVGTNFDFRGPAHQICPPPLVGNIVRRNYIQNIWREEVNTRMYPFYNRNRAVWARICQLILVGMPTCPLSANAYPPTDPNKIKMNFSVRSNHLLCRFPRGIRFEDSCMNIIFPVLSLHYLVHQ